VSWKVERRNNRHWKYYDDVLKVTVSLGFGFWDYKFLRIDFLLHSPHLAAVNYYMTMYKLAVRKSLAHGTETDIY
jgi:hypothetical protein